MTFDARESSIDSGQPIYLYLFNLGGINWRYTSADVDVTQNGFKWLAVAISDDGIAQSGEASSDALTITAPVSIGPVQMHMQTPPATAIMVSILHMHAGDPEAIVVYSGEVTQVSFITPGAATLACQTISASMQRDGLRLAWQRTCPYALYDPLTCRVNKALYAVPVVVLDKSGVTIVVNTVNGHPSGYFAGGFLQWTTPVGGMQTRMIEVHSETAFAMFGPTDDIHVGLQAVAYPGCARTIDACIGFNNLLNYGGVPHMPGRSPFDGNPVF